MQNLFYEREYIFTNIFWEEMRFFGSKSEYSIYYKLSELPKKTPESKYNLV